MTIGRGVLSESPSSVSSSQAGDARRAPVATCPEDGLSAFLRLRPRLFGIAYGMLGSVVEAEDIVQDVWLRWQTAHRGRVRDAAAFLVTTATRLAINVMQSARSRRETYLGPWLPAPVDTSADPRLRAERGEVLASAVLLLLERLTPTERAAFVLREAFDYAFRDIANVLRLGEANARQVVTRARQHVANGRRRPTSSSEQRRLFEAFIAAAQQGDLVGLEDVFASDVVSDRGPGRISERCSGAWNRSAARRRVHRGSRRRVLEQREACVRLTPGEEEPPACI